MKMIFFILWLLGSAVSMAADETPEATDSQMQSWEGRTRDELIASWGAPQQTLSDGRGGSIYVYILNPVFPIQGGSPVPEGQRIFWINDKGIIYKWSWKAPQAPSPY